MVVVGEGEAKPAPARERKKDLPGSTDSAKEENEKRGEDLGEDATEKKRELKKG